MNHPASPIPPLPDVVQLAPRFSVYQIGPDEFRIQSATQNIRINDPENGDVIADILSALLEPCDWRALVQFFSSDRQEHAQNFLHSLMEKGLLEDAAQMPEPDADRYRPQRLFFSHFEAGENPLAGPDAPKKDSHAQIRQASVLVIGMGQVGAFVVRVLARCGVKSVILADTEAVSSDDIRNGVYDARDAGHPRTEIMARHVNRINPEVETFPLPESATGLPEPAAFLNKNLVILCPDAFVPQVYESVNLRCLEAGVPWINYRQLGFDVTIGPLVIPGQSPCYKCADLRGLSNLSDMTERLYLHQYLNHQGRMETGMLPVPVAADFLAMEAIKHLSGFSAPSTIGHVLCTSVVNLQNRLRPLLKIPRCPHCGIKEGRRPRTDSWSYDNDA